MRGMGRIFKRGSIYWVAYNHRGQEHRESSQSENESVARKLLKKRIGEVATGQFIGPNEERLTFEELADALLTDYKINKQRSIRSVKLSLEHLRQAFGLMLALDVTTEDQEIYRRAPA
jgi:hypothetical protein